MKSLTALPVAYLRMDPEKGSGELLERSWVSST